MSSVLGPALEMRYNVWVWVVGKNPKHVFLSFELLASQVREFFKRRLTPRVLNTGVSVTFTLCAPFDGILFAAGNLRSLHFPPLDT